MWVSRKEFDELKTQYKDLKGFCERTFLQHASVGRERGEAVETLTKQMKCSCENYEVRDRRQIMCEHDGKIWWAADIEGCRYEKHCLDCGWTTTYDTEEEARADKQALLDKQMDALKEQKKSLKKK